MTDTGTPLMTSSEVADFFNISIHTLREWRENGTIEYIKLGRGIRYERAKMIAFVEHRRVQRRITPVSNDALEPVVNG